MSRDEKKVAHMKLLASKTSNLSLEEHCAGTATSWLSDRTVREVRHDDCDHCDKAALEIGEMVSCAPSLDPDWMRHRRNFLHTDSACW